MLESTSPPLTKNSNRHTIIEIREPVSKSNVAQKSAIRSDLSNTDLLKCVYSSLFRKEVLVKFDEICNNFPDKINLLISELFEVEKEDGLNIMVRIN